MTQNSVPTNLFSPEQMAEIQKDIEARLADDYCKKNFIPTADDVSQFLFRDVLNAMMHGLDKNPQDALLFDPQCVATIVQIVAPTLFVKPGIAAQADSTCFAMMQAYEHMNNALVSFIGQKYTMGDHGQPVEQPDTDDTIAAKEVLEKAIAQYAAAVKNVFASLTCTFDASSISGKYREAALVKHIHSEQPSHVDRSLYSGEFQADFNCYTAPVRLGLDVLQVLAFLADVNGGQINEMQFAALTSKFGCAAITLNHTGEIIVADTHDVAIRAALTPHRTWLAENLFALEDAMEEAEEPATDEVASDTKEVPVEQGSGVICEVAESLVTAMQYPAKVEHSIDGGITIAFRDLNTVAVELTEDTPEERAEVLMDVLVELMAVNVSVGKEIKLVPMPTDALGDEVLVDLPIDRVELVQCFNKQATAMNLQATTTAQLFAYPAKMTSRGDGVNIVNFRDLPLAPKIADDIVGQSALIVEGSVDGTSGLLGNLLEQYMKNGWAIPAPTPMMDGEVLVPVPASLFQSVQSYIASC